MADQWALLPEAAEAFGNEGRIYANFLRNESPLPPPAQGGSSAGGGGVIVSPTQPSTTRNGSLWFDTVGWALYIYVAPPGAWFWLC